VSVLMSWSIWSGLFIVHLVRTVRSNCGPF